VQLAFANEVDEHGESTTQAHIADHAKIERMTLSKSIRKLEENDLVLRTQSSAHTRSRHFQKTTNSFT
jgi:DNA-binding MarR family transcriptional regulator